MHPSTMTPETPTTPSQTKFKPSKRRPRPSSALRCDRSIATRHRRRTSTLSISLSFQLLLIMSSAIWGASAQLLPPGRFNECVSNLNTADQNGDGNGEVSSEEFVEFIRIHSDGLITETRFEDLPLGAVSNFNFVACQCASNGGDNQCCIGSNAHIDLSSSTFFNIFCTSIEAVIISEVGPLPTPPPTPFPTLSPTMSPPPTPQPTGPPTPQPSPLPTDTPSRAPAPEPTELPSLAPAPAPTEAPSSAPAIDPTDAPLIAPTAAPFSTPTSSPVTAAPILPTMQPTPGNLECVNIQYGITNELGFTAEDVLTRNGNTIADDLIAATSTIVQQIVSANFPGPVRLLRGSVNFGEIKQNSGLTPLISSLDGQQRRLTPISQRRLVELSDMFPVTIDGVVNNPFCEQKQSNPNVQCAVVSSSICVLLADSDDPATVRTALIDGLRTAVSDGSFVGAVPV